MRSHYGKVARVEVLSPLAVRFVLDSAGDRELPLILGLMPILPRHRFDETQFETTTLTPVIGSGPYRIEQVNAGRSVVYRRNPEYWGRDLSVQRGRHNFDEVHVDYFRDSNALFEAFKAGNVDVRVETEPARWAEAYGFPAVADGRVVKRDVATGLPAGMSGIAFNTRRAPLDDARVRQALIRLFDANWINRNLYHGLYSRTASYFSRSELASTGSVSRGREAGGHGGALAAAVDVGQRHRPRGAARGERASF